MTLIQGEAIAPPQNDLHLVVATPEVVFLSELYFQDFDSLINAGTNQTWIDIQTLPGWYTNRTTINAGTGSNNAGSLYSFGATGDTDRALGSVASNTTGDIYYGIRFLNDTDVVIPSLAINYIGEQWRNGGNTTPQKLDFAYQIGATDLTSGSWIDLDSLDFLGPIATASASALDGNANSISLSDTLTGLALASGDEIWLRWTDINDPGNDHGLAIDNLQVAVPEMTTLPPGVISLSSPYLQNFDSLISAGNAPWENTVTIPGWYATRSPIVTGTGSNNAGNLYSFGAIGDSDRALGSVASGGTGTIHYGARFYNDTDATITTLAVSYIGEQWRNGGNTTQHKLDFAYKIDATDLTTGSWIDVDALDFVGAIATSAAGALNGNDSANRVSISDAIAGLSLAPGEEIWLRWTDVDDPGSDHGLAIDNVQISTTALPGITLLETGGSTNVTEGGETDTYTLVLNTQPTNNVTVNILPDDQTTTTPSTVTFTPDNWNLSQTVTVIATDDDVIEGTHFSTISHTVTSDDSTYNAISLASIQATITDNDVVTEITKIHEIQGSGAVANFPSSFKTIEGIVVGDFQAVGSTSNLLGFYVQEEDEDADNNPLTSEGIFVFDDNLGIDVKVGDKVRVTGQVSEFASSGSSLTQLRNLTNITVVSENNSLPTATVLTFPLANINDLEAVEGMRVTIPQTMTVTEHFQLGRFGQIVLSSDGDTNQPGTDKRLEQYTQFNAPSISGNAAYLEEIAKRRIILDDGQGTQNPDPIIHGRGGEPLSGENTLRGGDTVIGLSGILDARFGDYRLQPVEPIDFSPSNPRPKTVPNVGGTIQVASFNVLNYFNGNGLGGGFPTPRGADNLLEFNRQREKIIQAILGMDADILGLIELENDGYGPNSAIRDLVNGLNAATGADTYAIIDPGTPQLGTDAIAVGFIYKPGSVTPVGEAATVPDGFGQGAFDNNNRKPLAQTFQENSSGEQFTAVVNHFKSKGSSAGGEGDADIGDGQAASNGTRVRASQDLLAWLATNPTGIDDPDYLIMGDINAYAKEDPIKALEIAGYQNQITNNSYSFVFDGQWGALDHVLANGSLAGQVTGAAKWHINADEPNVLDYNTNFKSPNQVESLYNLDPFRASDHDPVILGLNLFSVDNVIAARPGRREITGTTGNDVIIGGPGRKTIAGGGGNDQFVYQRISHVGHTIVDFTPGSDKVVLTELLNSLVPGGYHGSDAIADGYIRLVQGSTPTPNNTVLELDRDGPDGDAVFRTFIRFENVTPHQMNSIYNFVF
ncbi:MULTISPECIES: ExeM/NucH family extracellular endonuclease [unclassified Anabaena]|uniref:ExeM/NucH family extracellular endonuclease n=1 Tax=unclassified Anabaena TaxID=2619674 RepID=UPI0039C67944